MISTSGCSCRKRSNTARLARLCGSVESLPGMAPHQEPAARRRGVFSAFFAPAAAERPGQAASVIAAVSKGSQNRTHARAERRARGNIRAFTPARCSSRWTRQRPLPACPGREGGPPGKHNGRVTGRLCQGEIGLPVSRKQSGHTRGDTDVTGVAEPGETDPVQTRIISLRQAPASF